MWHGYMNGEKVCSSHWMWLCRWKLLRRIQREDCVWVKIHLETDVERPKKRTNASLRSGQSSD